MDAHGNFPFLKETILFLALSGVLMPLLSRLRINAVLGFFAPLSSATWAARERGERMTPDSASSGPPHNSFTSP